MLQIYGVHLIRDPVRTDSIYEIFLVFTYFPFLIQICEFCSHPPSAVIKSEEPPTAKLSDFSTHFRQLAETSFVPSAAI